MLSSAIAGDGVAPASAAEAMWTVNSIAVHPACRTAVLPALATVLAVMEQHAGDFEVVHACSSVVCWLSRSDDTLHGLRASDAGVRPALTAAMSRHPDHARIQEWCAEVLGRLA